MPTYTDRNPSPEQVARLVDHYQNTVWGKARANRADVDKLVTGTFTLWEGWPELAERSKTKYIPPFARNIIRHMMNQMSAYAPRIHREPVTKAEDARGEADGVEDALSESLMEVAKRSPLPVFKQMARYLFQYDYMVCKNYIETFKKDPPLRKEFDSDKAYKKAEERYEAEKRNWNPLRLDVPHPDQVLLDPFEKNPPFALHIYKTPAGKVRELSIAKLSGFEDGKMLEGQPFQLPSNEWEDVEVIEFWSDEWHKVYHGATLLYQEKNLWHFNPFNQAFGGQGYEGAGDRGAKPDILSDPFLLHLKHSIIMRTQQMNARHEILLRAAYALLALDPNQVNMDAVGQALAQGGAVPASPDRIGYIGVPNLPGHLMQEDAVLDRVIQEGSQATIASGINAPNVDTVGQTALLTERADNVSNDVRSQMESVTGIVASNFLRLVDVLDDMDMVPDGGLRFAQHRLDPRMLHGDYNARATFEVIDPVMLMQEKQLALSELQAEVMSLERYLKIARVNNATEEREQIILDKIRRTEPYASYYADLVLKKREQISLADFMQEMQQSIQNGTSLSDGLLNSGIGQRPGVQGTGGVQGAAATATQQLREPLGGLGGNTPKPAPRGR